MKKLFFIIVCALAMPTVADAAETEKLTNETRAAMKALAGELKATLQSSMKSEGPLKAIAVCNEKAPKLAEKISLETGLQVARTSLKTRNDMNAPDPWELSVLEQFEHRKSEGEPVERIEYSEMVEIEGLKVFRYMKAIPTDDVCLMCHGKHIADDLAAQLDKLYPNDKARGFSKGDIRGAFTVLKLIESSIPLQLQQ